MDEQERDALDALVLRCLDRVETEGPSAIEDLCGEHPEQADALRVRMKALLDAGLLLETDSPPERLGDFKLGKRLGGGGMGVVYAAVQESLGRRVALKIVRSDQLYFPGSRERFRREVQLVARLAHRGIVPVYTVGEEQGVPYFAMELLQGATLAEALAMLDVPPRRGRDIADAVSRVLEGRDGVRVDVGGELYEGSGVDTCVRIVRRVAEALAHAHERGVLHRDLKPTNVMLTADGRALLFDFGLASSTDSASLTQSGSRVGSLAYMSPEQVAGDEADERSDVYGLGALLCEALTLRPPHVGGPEAISAAILAGDPGSFRGRRSDLPRDVVTIVETALAHLPEQRYASAARMGRDLEAVLARRPIEARPIGFLARTGRWVQRHPARAGLLALIVITPVLFAIQQFVSKQEISAQSARAEANLDNALEALDIWVWKLGIGVLDHVPHVDAARLQMFEDAVASIDKLAAQRPADIPLLGRVVRLHAALGNVYLEFGRLADAEMRFRSAVDLGRASDVDDHEMIAPLNGLGNLLEKRGHLEEALALFEEAAEHFQEGRSHQPWLVACVVQRNMSRVHRRLGHWSEAVAAAEGAILSAELGLAAAETDEQRYDAKYVLGTALNQRAIPASDAPGSMPSGGEDERGTRAFERALPLLREVAAAEPHRSDVIHDAAAACVNAIHYLPPHEAEVVLREGLDHIERLRRDFPDRVAYVRIHVALSANLGWALVLQGRVAEAREWFELAATESAPWLEREDEDLTLLITAGRADVNLATNLVHLEQRSEACEPGERGAARIERALLLVPDEPSLRHDLAWARIQDGYGRLARGDGARTRELVDAIPVEEFADARITIAVGELVAGCADLASDPDEIAQLRDEALGLLERGLELGFTAFGYLRGTPEWASLREDPRFEELLRKASE